MDKQASQKVHKFLKQHPLGVISTVSEDSKPWGSPIYFVTDADLNFFFVTKQDTHKYKNIDRSPWVSLTVADNESQTTVQVLGKISHVPIEQAMDIALNKLEKIKPHGDYNWVPPILKVHKGDYRVLQITPTRLHYADFKQRKLNIHDDYIEKII